MEWTDEQRAAIDWIANWRRDPSAPRFASLTGAAGAGKTTALSALRGRLGPHVAWSAMTGRAATRLRELAGARARTLHSVLYHPPKFVDNEEERRIDLVFDEVKRSEPRLLIIDESSMIGLQIFRDICDSDYPKVLFVGDPFQIPAVLSRREEEESGGDWSVFSEAPGPHLGRVMRAQGAVLRAATEIRERGGVPAWSSEDGGSRYDFVRAGGASTILGRALKDWLSDREDHVLVTWRNEERMLANRSLRDYLGYRDPIPQPGEPVVVCKNAHEADLMNGDVVHLAEWLDDGPSIDLPGGEVKTRYARVQANFTTTAEPGSVDEAVARAQAQKTILVPMTGGKSGAFDGSFPYVGLEALERALREAAQKAEDRGLDFEPIPVTYGYCLTAHKCQGSQYRRVTTFLPGDLRNRNFQKQTRLPTGEALPFAVRFLYTAVSRARRHSTLLVSD